MPPSTADHRTLTLPTGEVVLYSPADAELVSRYKWHRVCREGRTTYVRACPPRDGGGQGALLLHRLLMGEPEGQVDHKNRNGLDNRRENLRLATRSQNAANTGPYEGRQYKGVYPSSNHRWQARVSVGGDRRYLGSFDTAEGAARAYDVAASEAHGEFAGLNFQPEQIS